MPSAKVINTGFITPGDKLNTHVLITICDKIVSHWFTITKR
nr:MAG TPA: hypothetical protein [Caudoviricetes sp.]